ncbi:hypothetical protein IV203_001144 [Nitzschia inconspicua]|uniref:Erythromycin biosynthesis protein CIII-like C-terminal domain-containing protein n=1 Tax=Nitzschia inconspicua TaxID=303405 RepID=A0A9K3PRC7_9STRA|nr:hypothetical protein IV203_001144 [Nitzschia inconspicua]
MRVLLLAGGTRGDIEPLCALAHELSRNEKRSFQVDFFVQRNLIPVASHLAKRPSCDEKASSTFQNDNSSSGSKIRLHVLPFSNQDFYSAVVSRDSRLDAKDPRMKSVAQVSAVISSLILPCYDQVEEVLLTPFIHHKTHVDHFTTTETEARITARTCVEDDSVIVTTFFTRPLAFLLARIHNVRVVIINLQPTVPNPVFPSYRVSVQNFVQAIIGYNDTTSKGQSRNITSHANRKNNTKTDDQNYAETYWRIEKALECTFLADTMQSIYHEKASRRRSSGDCSRYYNWEDLKRILSGQDERFLLVNAYSNHLVPTLAQEVSVKVREVGPLADAYLPPGEPTPSLVNFLAENTTSSCTPICVGFGSMKFAQIRTLLEALQSIQQPAVLVGSHLRVSDIQGDKSETGLRLQEFVKSHVYCASNIPYAWLLPHCSMMICHGGAGVVHACLRAGIPCVVLPVMGDQFAWGALLAAKGLGLIIQRRLDNSQSKDLTIEDFVYPIQSIRHEGSTSNEGESITKRCRSLGELIRKQPRSGAAAVADLIGSL